MLKIQFFTFRDPPVADPCSISSAIFNYRFPRLHVFRDNINNYVY